MELKKDAETYTICMSPLENQAFRAALGHWALNPTNFTCATDSKILQIAVQLSARNNAIYNLSADNILELTDMLREYDAHSAEFRLRAIAYLDENEFSRKVYRESVLGTAETVGRLAGQLANTLHEELIITNNPAPDFIPENW